MLEGFTDSVNVLFNRASDVAARCHSSKRIEAEHLLITLLEENTFARKIVGNCYSRNGAGYVDPALVASELKRELGYKDQLVTEKPVPMGCEDLLSEAMAHSRQLQGDCAGTDSLLYAISKTNGRAGNALHRHEIGTEKLDALIPITRWELGLPVYGSVAESFR